MRIFKSGLKQEITLKMTILVHYKLEKITISTDITFTQFLQNIRQNKRCPLNGEQNLNFFQTDTVKTCML